ncbi:MAG: hypothetical protein WC505_00320 [Patescibacteria group bacterium]
MKRKSLFLLPVLLVLTLFAVPQSVLAQTNAYDRYGGFIEALRNTARQGENYQTVKVPAGQTINDNFVRFADEVTIDGDIAGDLIIGAYELTVNGDVDGDIIAAAEEITINGAVAGNVRVAGSTVEVNGSIGKNANIFAGTAVLGEDASIGWTLAFWSGAIEINGAVGGSIYGYGGNVTLGSAVGSNVTVLLDELGRVTLEPGVTIGGDLTYRSDTDAAIAAGALVKGDTIHTMPFEDVLGARQFLHISWLLGKVIGLFSLLLVGTIIVSLMKRKTMEVAGALWDRPAPSVLWGLLILIGTPIAAVAITVTIIGIPLAMILMGTYALLIYLSTVFAGVLLGEKLLNAHREDGAKVAIIWTMMLGTFILYVLMSIPYAGWVFSLAVIALFLGTVWRLIHTAIAGKKESKSDAKSKS